MARCLCRGFISYKPDQEGRFCWRNNHPATHVNAKLSSVHKKSYWEMALSLNSMDCTQREHQHYQQEEQAKGRWPSHQWTWFAQTETVERQISVGLAFAPQQRKDAVVQRGGGLVRGVSAPEGNVRCSLALPQTSPLRLGINWHWALREGSWTVEAGYGWESSGDVVVAAAVSLSSISLWTNLKCEVSLHWIAIPVASFFLLCFIIYGVHVSK